jgi:curved DNA-binding protein
MDFKDYYATLGVERTATEAEIKNAYRKLARKYHPDVSKEPNAEARFKEVAEAHEALSDAERRAAYDDIGRRHRPGEAFEPPPDWGSGYEFSGRGGAGHSDFFESLFGRGRQGRGRAAMPQQGGDHHAKVSVELEDAFHGGQRQITLRVPATGGPGQPALHERQLEVNIPKGVRQGQRLRLAGQGRAGSGGGPAGDLYLEIELAPHRLFRLDGRDLYLELPLAPWEAALGATVTAPTLDGPVQLTIAPGSLPGRKLRLKGKGMPGTPQGDLFAVLRVTVPVAGTDAEREAYAAMAAAFPSFEARAGLND